MPVTPHDLLSVFLNSFPALFEQPCIVWSGEAIPKFVLDSFPHQSAIDYVMFAPEGTTLPSFFDMMDCGVTVKSLPKHGGVLYIKRLVPFQVGKP